ncbi:energy transducer TonB [Vogesella facilis]|uniref:Energy transducer TonB n=1 Tax=Vogesella facilis TaxID=1655232 RepID=A0ABV7RGB6_9NEIS
MSACFARLRPLLASALLALAAHAALLLLPLAPAGQGGGGRPLAVTLASAAPAPPAVPATQPAAPSAVPVSVEAAPPAVVPVEAPVDAAVAASQPVAEAPLLPASAPTAALPGLALDPYYPAGELDVLAAPIGQLLLDYPAGSPEQLQLQLYIGRDGTVDKVEVIAGNGDSDYARFVVAVFQQAHFMPAQKGGVAVRSRKHIQLALQPH